MIHGRGRALPSDFSWKLTHHIFSLATKAMTIRPVSRIRTYCTCSYLPRYITCCNAADLPGHLKWRCQKLIWVVRKYAGDTGDAFQSFATVITSSKRRPELGLLTTAANSDGVETGDSRESSSTAAATQLDYILFGEL